MFNQKRMLTKAKIKRLGIAEALYLKAVGAGDGKAGLPKQELSGDWASPYLRKEADAYSEFCHKAWGLTELELSEAYKKTEALLDMVSRKEEILANLQKEKPEQQNDAYFKERKSGEEDLTDGQVYTRRANENRKRNSSYYGSVKKLEEEIDALYAQLDEQLNHIIETNNGTRLICGRLRDHTKQRIDAYWNAALKVHPMKDKMQATPSPLPESDAELMYTSHHRSLLQIANKKEVA